MYIQGMKSDGKFKNVGKPKLVVTPSIEEFII